VRTLPTKFPTSYAKSARAVSLYNSTAYVCLPAGPDNICYHQHGPLFETDNQRREKIDPNVHCVSWRGTQWECAGGSAGFLLRLFIRRPGQHHFHTIEQVPIVSSQHHGGCKDSGKLLKMQDIYLLQNQYSRVQFPPGAPRFGYVNKPSRLTSVQLSLQGLKHEDNLLLKP
jgi:hypothetical protein